PPASRRRRNATPHSRVPRCRIFQTLGLSPAAGPPRGETPRRGHRAIAAPAACPRPNDRGWSRPARIRRWAATSARSAPAHHPRSFGRKSDALCNMETQQFEIPTRDGRTRLTGQVDLPAGDGAARHPAVLMVPGGWFMDRDGYMGGSGTERDLIYRNLAKDIVAARIAVVRDDNRGVRCNELTMPPCPEGSNEPELTKHYLNACVDPDVRQTVTVQTQMDDVEDVWAFTVNHPGIDPTRALIWAHSEGCGNTARLIGARRICPRAVIFVGTATESPSGLVRWQTVDRYAEHVMGWDADVDGRVTEADVERQFPKDPPFTAGGMRRDVLTPPAEGWALETIRARFAGGDEAMRGAALAKPGDAPDPAPAPGR